MIDFRLETFLTLCKILNYTKTAEILHITQPAVSQHISYLEHSYGVKLFSYVGKNLSLTESGQMLYNFALAMKSSSDKIRSQISSPKDNKQTINFGTTLTIGEYTMPKLLSRLLIDYPNINITMEVGNTKDLLYKLKDGQVDFVFLEGHFKKLDYDSKLFSRESFIGICSPDHDFAHNSINFQDLFNERLILREEGSGTREIFEQILYEQNINMKSFNTVTEIGNINLIKELVARNHGITFLYEEAVKEELASNKLGKINLKDFLVTREFNFVFLRDSLHKDEYLNWFDYFNSIR